MWQGFLHGDRMRSALRPGRGRDPLMPPNCTWETFVRSFYFIFATDVSDHEMQDVNVILLRSKQTCSLIRLRVRFISHILKLLVSTKLLIPGSQGHKCMNQTRLKCVCMLRMYVDSHMCFKLHEVIDSLLVFPSRVKINNNRRRLGSSVQMLSLCVAAAAWII